MSIAAAALRVLDEVPEPSEVPEGEFWEWAFHRDVLKTLCRFREGLLKDCRSDARKALRAILLGALHGPRRKSRPSHFSNQSPRTYAPKPRYAVGYWKRRGIVPEPVDVFDIVMERARRYYCDVSKSPVGRIIYGDSRDQDVCTLAAGHDKVSWVITSPPYYGLRTYIPDQWLRHWFLGGPAKVEYSREARSFIQALKYSPRSSGKSGRTLGRFASRVRALWLGLAASTTGKPTRSRYSSYP